MPARAVVRVPGPHTRYTFAAEAAAESRVAQDLARLATGAYAELGDHLRSLVLVGPFARAEGGFRLGPDGEPLAHPGYDLLAVFKRKPERHARATGAMAAAWSRLLHTRVRIRVLAQRDLPRVPATRFWYHAGRGQLITLAGDPALTASLPRYDAAQLVREACAYAVVEGLTALALGQLLEQDEPALVGHTHRAVLACADAMLLSRRAYAPNFEQRVLRLQDAMTPTALVAAYEDAMAYTGQPEAWQPAEGARSDWLSVTRKQLAGWHLGFEQRRIGTPLDAMAYATHGTPLFEDPEQRVRAPVRSALRALPLLSPELSSRLADPRERVLRCVVALAYRPADPAARQHAATLLRCGRREAPPDGATLARALCALAEQALPEDLGRPFAEWNTGVTGNN